MNRFKYALAILPVALLVTACGSGSDSDSSDAGKPTGSLRVGTLNGAPPYGSLADDGKTFVGYETDLITEAAKRMKLKREYTVLDFESLLPGLTAGRFDVAMAGFQESEERESEKYDAVTVTNEQFVFGTTPELAAKTKSFLDVCGKKLGSLPSGLYEKLFNEANAACAKAGKPKIDIRQFDGDAQLFLALKSGQVDYLPNTIPIIAEFVKDNPKFVATDYVFYSGRSAWYLKKGSPLAPKLSKALNEMIADGSYAKILKKYNISEIALDESKVNPLLDDLKK